MIRPDLTRILVAERGGRDYFVEGWRGRGLWSEARWARRHSIKRANGASDGHLYCPPRGATGVEPPMTILSVLVLVAFALSIVLFSLNVFSWDRQGNGQIRGLVFAALGAILYAILYADRIPFIPIRLRNVLEWLPGVNHQDLLFASPEWSLWVLCGIYVLRAAIFTRLFIVPAITLNDAEYNAPDQIEARANDATAPILAYVAFSVVAGALVGALYGLMSWAGVLLAIGIGALYFLKPLVQRMKKVVATAYAYFIIALRVVGAALSTAIIEVVLVIARIERWRSSESPDDQNYYEQLAKRLITAREEARQRNAAERARMREMTQQAREQKVET